jgi:hypothetical protein
MEVPSFLLRRLYVAGSLRNTNSGFAFDLRNSLGSGYAERVFPVTIDGAEYPLAATRFVTGQESLRFADVSPSRPMTLAMNRTLAVIIDGEPLSDGKHTIGLGFFVVGMGEMRFEVSDAIEQAADGDDAA